MQSNLLNFNSICNTLITQKAHMNLILHSEGGICCCFVALLDGDSHDKCIRGWLGHGTYHNLVEGFRQICLSKQCRIISDFSQRRSA